MALDKLTLNIPSPVIQEVSGHRNLEELQKYLYDDVETGRTPVRSPFERCMYDDLEENSSSTLIEGSGLIEKDS